MLNPIAGEAMTRQLEEQIAGMQAELAAAHVQIHRSEGRLRDSVQSLTELEASVRRVAGGSAPAAAGDAPPAPPAAEPRQRQQQLQQAAAAPQAAAAAAPAAARRGGRPRKAGSGVASSLAIPAQLRNHWFPAEFSGSLTEGRMVPFELFGQVRLRGRHACAAVAWMRGCACVAAPAWLRLRACAGSGGRRTPLALRAAARASPRWAPALMPPLSLPFPADVGAVPGRERRGGLRQG